MRREGVLYCNCECKQALHILAQVFVHQIEALYTCGHVERNPATQRNSRQHYSWHSHDEHTVSTCGRFTGRCLNIAATIVSSILDEQRAISRLRIQLQLVVPRLLAAVVRTTPKYCLLRRQQIAYMPAAYGRMRMCAAAPLAHALYYG